jgi:mono/diheme cytochrome c family protein
MRWTRWIALSAMAAATLVAMSFVFSCSATRTSTETKPAAMTAEQEVERGRYLMNAMPCIDCHTPGTFYGAPDTTRMYSGSEIGWVGPWGTVCAPNLTPDSTGLGTWTEDQIATVIRTGNRPDGRQLAPIMPWMSFTNLTDDDAHAIAAYLKSLKPVRHTVPAPLPPGTKPTGAFVAFPPPPAWDAMNLPKPHAAK